MLEARLLNIVKAEIARCGRECDCCWVEPIPREEAQRLVAEATAKLRRAQDAYLRGLLDLDQVEEVDGELRQAKSLAEQSKPTLADEATSRPAAAAMREAMALFRAGSVQEANTLLRKTVACIELDSAAESIRVVLLARVRDKASAW